MAATVAKARIQQKKVQLQYKRDFDKRMRRGNTNIKELYYVWLDVQDVK